MKNFIGELRQRRIWRVLIAYPGAAYVILEAVGFFIDHYGLDARLLTATIIGAIGLLPAALMESWHAWTYRLCGKDGLFQRSADRIETLKTQNLEGIDSALFYLYVLEGRDDDLRDLILGLIDSKNPLTLFMQFPLLNLPGWKIDAIRDDPEYRKAIRGLNFPPNPWSVE